MSKLLLTLGMLCCGYGVFAQEPAELPEDTSAMACSFSCSNTLDHLKQQCFNDMGVIRLQPIPVNNVNPYWEFDAIVSLLRKKNSQEEFPLTYIFAECPATCNAASISTTTGQYIFYNKTFLNQLALQDTALQWAVRSIIAHEIGHQVLGHTTRTGNLNYSERRKMELEADFFSGAVMRLFDKCSVENSVAGLRSIDNATYLPRTSEQEKKSYYPLMATRYSAVREGYATETQTPVKLTMYRRIDSIALMNLSRFGGTVIFRVMDKAISMNDFNKANLLLQQLKHLHEFQEKDLEEKVRSYEQLLQEKGALKNLPASLLQQLTDKRKFQGLELQYNQLLLEDKQPSKPALDRIKRNLDQLKQDGQVQPLNRQQLRKLEGVKNDIERLKEARMRE